MIDLTEKEIETGTLCSLRRWRSVVKTIVGSGEARGGPKVLFSSRRLEKQLVLSSLHRNGFKRNIMNTNDLKRREVFERKTSRRETQQPNLNERTQSAPNQ